MVTLIPIAVLVFVSPDEKKQLQDLVTAHRAARDSVVTIAGNIQQQTEERASPLNLTGTFWKNSDGYRVRVERQPDSTFRDRMVDSLYLRGQFQQVIRRSRGSGEETILLKQEKKSILDFGNPWLFGLLAFIGPKSIGAYTLEETLENKELTLSSISNETIDGTPAVTIRLKHAAGEFLLRFSAKVNYLTQRVEYSVGSGRIRSVHEVKSFAEPEPGLFFPEKIVMSNYVSGQLRETVTTQIRIISMNQPIPSAVFVSPIPRGTLCHDLINNQLYKVDSQGNRIGPLLDKAGKPLSSVATPSDAKADATPSPVPPPTLLGQTQQESFSWLWLLVAGSIGLLSAAGIIVYVNRRA
jgi:hypothetical protein